MDEKLLPFIHEKAKAIALYAITIYSSAHMASLFSYIVATEYKIIKICPYTKITITSCQATNEI